jgi:hypothetical protein
MTSARRKVTAKKLQAVQTSRHFHMAQRQHTGHILPKQHTSYPVLFMLLLSVGVVLGSWTRAVDAATSGQGVYTVHASVAGEAPTQAATIDSPNDGDSFTSTPITVSGTCPAQTYIQLERNGFSSGTALCQVDGSYSLQTDLFPGQNNLIAQDYNFGDTAGPVSDQVTVSYTPPVIVTPVVPTGGNNTTPSSTQTVEPSIPTKSSTSATVAPKKVVYVPGSPTAATIPEPLLVKSSDTFSGFYTGQTANYQIGVEGGTAPYAISVDWGDGSHSLYSRPQASGLNIEHVYRKTGGYHGSYVIKITATDASSNQTFLQIVTIVSNPPTSAGQKSIATTSGSSSSTANGLFSGDDDLGRLVKFVWPSYGVLILMFISFWLGERREYHYLQPRLRRKRRAHA